MTVSVIWEGVWGSKVTAKLRKHDVKTLIGLLTLEMDRLGEAKEKCGCGDPSYFYHLIDIRNKLLTLPSDAELPPHLSDKELEKLFEGRGLGK